MSQAPAHLSDPGRARPQPQRLTVGLLNNMSDGALKATEQQFSTLLEGAALPGLEIRLRYFSLGELARGDATRAYMRGRYESLPELFGTPIDALVVTGAEPRTARLEEESYWPSLARVIDWTRDAKVPTVWSCLAAHAAVWRLRGVARKRLPAKHSGVFELSMANDHPLLKGVPVPSIAPHSRLNDLAASELEQAGYQILTLSDIVGVDAFVAPGPALTLFLQGHPEYDAGALAREYLRDVSRFLRGDQAHHPAAPAGYFDGSTLQILQALSKRAERSRDLGLLGDYARAVEDGAPQAVWRPWASHVYRRWLAHVADARSGGESHLAGSRLGVH